MSGKGDRDRTTDRKAYRENYAGIDWGKSAGSFEFPALYEQGEVLIGAAWHEAPEPISERCPECGLPPSEITAVHAKFDYRNGFRCGRGHVWWRP